MLILQILRYHNPSIFSNDAREAAAIAHLHALLQLTAADVPQSACDTPQVLIAPSSIPSTKIDK